MRGTIANVSKWYVAEQLVETGPTDDPIGRFYHIDQNTGTVFERTDDGWREAGPLFKAPTMYGFSVFDDFDRSPAAGCPSGTWDARYDLLGKNLASEHWASRCWLSTGMPNTGEDQSWHLSGYGSARAISGHTYDLGIPPEPSMSQGDWLIEGESDIPDGPWNHRHIMRMRFSFTRDMGVVSPEYQYPQFHRSFEYKWVGPDLDGVRVIARLDDAPVVGPPDQPDRTWRSGLYMSYGQLWEDKHVFSQMDLPDGEYEMVVDAIGGGQRATLLNLNDGTRVSVSSDQMVDYSDDWSARPVIEFRAEMGDVNPNDPYGNEVYDIWQIDFSLGPLEGDRFTDVYVGKGDNVATTFFGFATDPGQDVTWTVDGIEVVPANYDHEGGWVEFDRPPDYGAVVRQSGVRARDV